MKLIYLLRLGLLLTVIMLAGCGGGSSGGGGSSHTNALPDPVAPPATEPTPEPTPEPPPEPPTPEPTPVDISPLRPVNSAEKFAASIRNGLRLVLDGGVGGYFLGTGSDQLDFSPAPDPSSSSGGFSTTNVQVAGVDEGDFVKYDGRHLYVYRSPYYYRDRGEWRQPSLRILQTLPEQAAVEVIGELALTRDEGIDALYLVDGEQQASAVVTLTQRRATEEDQAGLPADSVLIEGVLQTRVDVIDVTDPRTPSLDWRLEFQGAIVSTRKIDNTLYLVAHHSILSHYYAYLSQLPLTEGGGSPWEDIDLESIPIDKLLPRYRTNGGKTQPLLAPSSCLVARQPDDDSGLVDLFSVIALDLNTRQFASPLCLHTPVNGIYSSADNLYLNATLYQYTIVEPEPEPDQTEPPMPVDEPATDETSPATPMRVREVFTVIHKIALANNDPAYRATGQVAGELGWQAPQFRMDELGDDLRVVSTTDLNPEPKHQLSILRDNNEGTLQMVASLPNADQPAAIGKPGEQIYAVRFFGERAFIVTFERTDPLYTLDLSDPLRPRISGELEIPGFSNYLHPINESWILSVGNEVVNGITGGIKVELFDIREGNPRSVGSTTIGRAGSLSTASDDHRALTFLSDTSGDMLKMALPVHVADTPLPQSNFFDWTHSGLYLFEISGLNTDAAVLQEAGAIISARRDDDGVNRPIRYPGGRSVLHDEAVFYIYNGSVWSAFWNTPETAIGDQ